MTNIDFVLAFICKCCVQIHQPLTQAVNDIMKHVKQSGDGKAEVFLPQTIH